MNQHTPGPWIAQPDKAPVRDCPHGRQINKCADCDLTEAEAHIYYLQEQITKDTARIAVLEDALHQISLCSQYSMSSQRECGAIARKALGETK